MKEIFYERAKTLSIKYDYIKRQLDDNNDDWYNRQRDQAILQALGRGIRNENDYCFNLLCDYRYKGILENYDKNIVKIRTYHKY